MFLLHVCACGICVYVCVASEFRESLKTSDEQLRRQFVISIGWTTSLNTLINNMEG